MERTNVKRDHEFECNQRAMMQVEDVTGIYCYFPAQLISKNEKLEYWSLGFLDEKKPVDEGHV
ncbi:unnamed protein product [Brassica oleracea]